MIVAALFVSPRGPYVDRPDVDTWDEARDARRYDGTAPVVVHPPCNLWVNNAAVNWVRYREVLPAWYPGGSDGGCFASAVATLRRVGGVLEHPADSHAWERHGLPVPLYGRRGFGWRFECGVWVCEVWQSAYGHRARKRTWLAYVGQQPPFELDWRRDPGTHQVGWANHIRRNNKRSLSKQQTILTPSTFADTLIALARHSKGNMQQIQTTNAPAVLTVAEQSDPIIAALRTSAEAFKQWAVEFARNVDANKIELATQAIKHAKIYSAAIDEHRKSIVEGPKRELRKIDERFATARDPYNEAVEILQSAVGEFLAAQRDVATTAFDAAAHALAVGDTATASAKLETYNATNIAHEGSLATSVTVEIVNRSIVPAEWWDIAETRLKDAREADPTLTVPGVIFHESNRLVVAKPRNSRRKAT